MTLPTIIALCVLGAFIAFIIYTQVKRKSIAEMALDVPSYLYTGRDTVRGSLAFRAKKSLNVSALKISLVCTDSADRGPHASPSYEIFRQEQPLATGLALDPEALRTFTFEFLVPEHIDENALSLDAPKAVEGMLAPLMDKGIRRRAMDIHWTIEAVATIDDLDVIEVCSVNIDVMP